MALSIVQICECGHPVIRHTDARGCIRCECNLGMKEAAQMSFEAYRTQGKKKAWIGCSRCGKEGKSDGTVEVSLKDRTETKIATLASTSRSMCEPCTVQTYEEVVVFMLSKMK